MDPRDIAFSESASISCNPYADQPGPVDESGGLSGEAVADLIPFPAKAGGRIPDRRWYELSRRAGRSPSSVSRLWEQAA